MLYRFYQHISRVVLSVSLVCGLILGVGLAPTFAEERLKPLIRTLGGPSFLDTDSSDMKVVFISQEERKLCVTVLNDGYTGEVSINIGDKTSGEHLSKGDAMAICAKAKEVKLKCFNGCYWRVDDGS